MSAYVSQDAFGSGKEDGKDQDLASDQKEDDFWMCYYKVTEEIGFIQIVVFVTYVYDPECVLSGSTLHQEALRQSGVLPFHTQSNIPFCQ